MRHVLMPRCRSAFLMCCRAAAATERHVPPPRRAFHLPKLDQQQMIDIRAAWFDGNYGPPPGNKRERWAAAMRPWRLILRAGGCMQLWPVCCTGRAAAPAGVRRCANRCFALPCPLRAVPHERDQWQQAPEGHTISERGKMQVKHEAVHDARRMH